MGFLTLYDYHKLIDPDDLADLLEKYPAKLQGLEQFAQEEISTYLRGRYDISKVFKGSEPFDNFKTYNKGDLVTITGVHYECQADATLGINPVGASPTIWSPKDNRNQTVVWCMVVIVIYNLCVAIVPRDIPEIRKNMYYGIDDKQQDGVLYILKSIRSGKNSFDLPLVAEPEIPNTFITMGSEQIKEIEY